MLAFLRRLFGLAAAGARAVEADLAAQARAAMLHLKPTLIKLVRAEVLMMPDGLNVATFRAQLKNRLLDTILQIHIGNPLLEAEKASLVELLSVVLDRVPADIPLDVLKGHCLETLTRALMGETMDVNKSIMPADFGGVRPSWSQHVNLAGGGGASAPDPGQVTHAVAKRVHKAAPVSETLGGFPKVASAVSDPAAPPARVPPAADPAPIVYDAEAWHS